MIEVNLLPKELRKPARKVNIELPDVKFVPIAIGLVALIIFIQLALSFTVNAKRRRVVELEKKWSDLRPKKEEVLVIDRQVNALGDRLNSISDIKKTSVSWARKLNALSDSLIPGMWLTSLTVEDDSGRRYLSIRGNISSFWKDETAMIGKFMKTLKENRSFAKDFEEIKLDTIQQKTVKDSEVMDFSIKCYFEKTG